jgi:putative ABC transport system permease protein
MLTNIREQGREVGVLRALGITRPQTVRLYLHEAVLLVLSASFSGIVIGSITAWTFSMQQQLFTGLPVPFVLPWGVIAVVVIMALVLGIFAAALPAWRSVKRPITVLLRGQ